MLFLFLFLVIAGGILLMSTASVSAATSVGTSVTTGGNVAATGTLQVTGAVTTYGAVTLGDAYADSITINGVVGSLFASSTLQTTGAVTTYGAVTLGDAYADSLTVNSRIASSLFASSTLQVTNALTTYDAVTLGDAYADSITINGVVGSLFVSSTLQTTGAVTTYGAVTLGDAYADSITINGVVGSLFASSTLQVTGNVTAYNSLRVFANVTSTSHIYPASNNEVDLGAFSYAFRDAYVSSTLFVGDLSDLLYVDKANSRIGVASSSPSTQFSVGSGPTATSSVSFGQLCFRSTVQSGATRSEVYYWPCVGDACPTAAMAAAGWATSTASCY